ncbi:Putative esterase [Singulisphaera sp. GP187]|uniref:glycosyltransferase family 39 protein n=1 Tax=Singulisphaera sp. GP187 TaxID=1882752 RepID=UPI0009287A2E|nr:glycosyltransferase family 39 protein [Singulisphaera sp. GP187]SIO64678.1 Putative esterase [Singulisphaera sp. GP187]
MNLNLKDVAFYSIVVGLNLGLATIASLHHYATVDEARSIPAGLAHWDAGAFAPANDTPPVARLVATLPVLALHPNRIESSEVLEGRLADEADLKAARDFAYTNPLTYDHLIRIARLPTLFWWVAGAWLITRWAGELHGTGAARLALVLWAFGPNIIAREALATPDLPAAVACLAAGYAFSRWRSKSSWSRAAVTGALLGIAMLTEYSALSLPLAWLLLGLPRCPVLGMGDRTARCWVQVAQTAFGLFICLWVINIGYGFTGTGTPLGKLHFTSRVFGDNKANHPDATIADAGRVRNRFEGSWLGGFPLPLPADYIRGMDRRFRDAESSFQTIEVDASRATDRGRITVAILLAKVPIAAWILILWGVALSIRRDCPADERAVWIQAATMIAPAVILANDFFPLASMLLAAPFTIVGISGLARYLGRVTPKATALIVILLIGIFASGLSTYPHLLSYLNESVRGADRFALAASHPHSDAGRDLLELKNWLGRHQEASPIGLACQYVNDPRALGIEYTHIPTGPGPVLQDDPWYSERLGPKPGYYALDFHNLTLPRFRYFNDFRPAFVIGDSIRIYHITPEDADRARRKAGLANTRDLLELKNWLGRHQEASPIGLACQYVNDPRALGIEYTHIPTGPGPVLQDDPWYSERLGPKPGYYALDLHNLTLPRFRYFNDFRPAFVIGDSIRIYHITPEDADRARRKAGLAPLATRPGRRGFANGSGFVHRVHRGKDGSVTNYTIFVPHDYTGEISYPLILLLHGYGDRGTAGDQYLKVGLAPAIARRENDFDFIAIFPQGHAGAWPPDGDDTQHTMEILAQVEAEYRVDPRRIYLTGISSGGAGVWPIAARSPDRWAAIVPVASAECDPAIATAIKSIPCWCFHNYFDVSKPPGIPRQMIEALRREGGKPRYTEFYVLTGDRHNAWDSAYNTIELYDWLAGQRKPEPHRMRTDGR